MVGDKIGIHTFISQNYNVMDFGATGNGTTDDYTSIQTAIDTAAEGSTILFPPGSYAIGTQLAITKPLHFVGSGTELTIFTASSGLATGLLSVALTTQGAFQLKDFSVDMSAAPTVAAISLDNLLAGSVSNVKITKGTYGIDISNTGLSRFDGIHIYNPTTAGIRLQGDGGQEDYFNDIWIVNDDSGTTTADGFCVTRTTGDDTGGIYMSGVRVVQNAAGGNITNGIRLQSTFGTPTPMFALITDCVVDGIEGGDSILLRNIRRSRLEGCHVTNGAAVGSAFAAIRVRDSSQTNLIGNLFASSHGDVALQGSVDSLYLIGNQLYGDGPVAIGHIYLASSPTITNSQVVVNPYDSTTVFSNDATTLAAGTFNYDDHGAWTIGSLTTSLAVEAGTHVRIPNAEYYQTKTAGGSAIAILGADSSDNIGFGSSNGASYIFYKDQYVNEGLRIDSSGNFIPANGAGQQTLGDDTHQWRVYHEVVATGSLPAAASAMDGTILIENAGAGDRNVILYAGGQRFRIDGGAAF